MAIDTTENPIKKMQALGLKSDTWDWTVENNGEEFGRCRFTIEQDHIYIDDLSVVKEKRRSGIGTRLIQLLEEHATANGYTEIRGSAVAYKNEEPSYSLELEAWWRNRGYEFNYSSPNPENRHIGNFHKKIGKTGQ